MTTVKFSPLRLRAIIDENKRKAQIKQIAAGVGVTESTIQNWLTGFCKPSLDDALKLAACLGVELEVLCDEQESAAGH